MIDVQVNGEVRECAEGLSLSDLVRELSLPPERIAIEHNQQVVRRTEWPKTLLAAGDRIEIVHFVGGGSSQKAVGRKQSAAGKRSTAFSISLLAGVESV